MQKATSHHSDNYLVQLMRPLEPGHLGEDYPVMMFF